MGLAHRLPRAVRPPDRQAAQGRRAGHQRGGQARADKVAAGKHGQKTPRQDP